MPTTATRSLIIDVNQTVGGAGLTALAAALDQMERYSTGYPLIVEQFNKVVRGAELTTLAAANTERSTGAAVVGTSVQPEHQHHPTLSTGQPSAREETVAHQVTELGIDVSEMFVVKVARTTNEMRQYELTDGSGHVLLDGIGNDRFEALTAIMFRLLLGEDFELPND